MSDKNLGKGIYAKYLYTVVMKKQNIKDFLPRTVIINIRQSKELSEKTRKNKDAQKYFYDEGITFGLNGKTQQV